MIPCPTHAVLEAMLADQLSPPIEASLESHIRECSSCQEALETMTADTRTRRDRATASEELGFLADSAILSAMAIDATATSFSSVLPWVKPVATPVLPKLPGYEVFGEVGRGGMGVVYRARHVALNRIVALKMLRSGEQADPADRARFQAEAEAVARLQHPNIVQIYDTGMAADQPYFALEFVEGGSLAKLIDQTPQSPRQAAELVETLARAIHAAHERGIVHRDLKPSNILLRIEACELRIEKQGNPSAHSKSAIRNPQSAIPKITDFGLAKLLDRPSDLTGSRDILGTPSYMAPEQARGGSSELGPATDIYALGAILYDMLTGRPPFRAETPYDTVLQVVQEEPVPPTQFQRKVPRDLETICLKCLQKEPRQRYATALALADDLRRFLNGEPILARPVSLWRRGFKWAQRRPMQATLLAAVISLTVLAMVSLSEAAFQAQKAAQLEKDRLEQEAGLRRIAEKERQRAEQLSARTLLDLGISQCDKGNFDHGLHQFVRALTLAGQLPDPDLEYAARASLACWRPYFLRAWGLLQHRDWVWVVAFSPDGKYVATGSKDRTARVWNATTGEPITPPLSHPDPVWSLAFSPDGKTLVTGSGHREQGEVRHWDVASGKPIGTPLTHGDEVHSIAFAPDGKMFLTHCSNQVQVWDSASRARVGKPIRHTGAIRLALFSPDGKTVLTGGADSTVQLWESDTGASRGLVMNHPGPVTAAAFSPDGTKLLTACDLSDNDVNKQRRINGAARLWRTDTGKAISPPLVHQGPVMSVAFSPDGRIGLTGGLVPGTPASPSPKGEAYLWRAEIDDPQIGKRIGPILEHPAPVWSVAFSPSGRTILTGCEDRRARLWAAGSDYLIATSPPHEGTVRQAVYAPDGRTILTASAGTLAAGRLWETPPETGFTVLSGDIGPLQAWAISADGRFAVIAGGAGQSEVWDTTTGRRIGKRLINRGAIWSANFSADGRTVLIGTTGEGSERGGELCFWDRATGQPSRPPLPHESGIHAIACTSDGRFILTGTEDGKIRLWDNSSSQVRYTVSHSKSLLTLELSADNQTFVSGSKDGTAQLWETATGKHLQTWTHPDWAKAGGLTPDGRLCLVGSGKSAYLWEVATGKLLVPPRSQPDSIHGNCFHPDGRSYFTGNWDGAFQRWDIALGKPLGPALQFKQMLSVVAAGSNSRVLIGGYKSTTATLCNAPAALAGDISRIKLAVEVLTGKEMDSDGTIRELTLPEWNARRQELQRQGGDPFARVLTVPQAVAPGKNGT